jgi:hypothetical protein
MGEFKEMLNLSINALEKLINDSIFAAAKDEK